jgi:hypothetical protein
MQIVIQVDKGHLRDVEKSLRGIPNGYPTAVRRALARATPTGKTSISKAVRAEIALKKKDTDQRLKSKVVSAGKLPEGVITITRQAVPLVLYGAQQRRPGVSVKVRKSEGRQILKSTFLHKSRAGRLNVNERKRTGSTRVGRLPIEPRFGPTVLGVFENNPLGERELRGLGLTFHKRLDHEVAFLVRKAAAKK